MSVRDSQRKKLYTAERAFWKTHSCYTYKPDFNNGGLQELIQQVGAIWNDPMVQKAFPELVGWRVPKVKYKRGRGAHAAPFFHEVAFSRDTCQPWVVLHELSHIIHAELARNNADVPQADHGPEYAAVYLYLTELSYGFEARQGLSAAFAQGRVKVAPRVVRKR